MPTKPIPMLVTLLGVALLPLASGCGSNKSSEDKSGAATTTSSTAAAKPQPLGPSDVLAGTVTINPPAGTPGKLSVVTIGVLVGPSDTWMPVIIRNNTSDAVSHVDLTATAKKSSGKVIGSGTSQNLAPQNIDPGEASLVYVYFQNKIPPGATFDFSFDSQPPSTDSFNTADLKVVQANHVGSHIVGTAKNSTGKPVDGPFAVSVFCFSQAHMLTTTQGTYANGPDPLPPNKSVSFDIDLLTMPCPEHLVGSSGYYK
jgi:hypothetical protein